ncbi:cell division protein FtsZ, partial [Xanthomonas citri pv. citri]|nr:cell division protein FtsZ [Xanthomonas citri pv. citri]
VFGTSVYPEMEGKLRVTLVATGIGQAEELTLPRATVVPQPMQQPMQQQSYQQQAQQPQQPAFAQQGYAQPAQFAQPQQAAPKPQQVDSS